MKTPIEITSECDHVEMLISQPIPDEASKLREYGDELSAWLATMARNVADARMHHRKGVVAITKTVMADKDLSRLTPMVMNKYIGAAANEYAYLEDISDRMYSALSKRLEWVRSQLSYLKQEMHDLKYQQQ